MQEKKNIPVAVCVIVTTDSVKARITCTINDRSPWRNDTRRRCNLGGMGRIVDRVVCRDSQPPGSRAICNRN